MKRTKPNSHPLYLCPKSMLSHSIQGLLLACLLWLGAAAVWSPPLLAAGDDDCATPPPNMVGWWPFDEFAGGSTAEDTVQGNDGIYVSSPTPDFGKVGGGITVNTWSGNHHVEIPHHPDYNFGTGDFSIDAWVQANGLGPFLSKFDGNIGWELKIELIANLNLFVTVEGSGGGFTNQHCGTLPGSQIWYHIAVTVDRSTDEVRCFIDGVPIGTITDPVTGSVDNTEPVRVGKGGGSSPSGFQGIIDELELFDAELSDADITAVADAGVFGKCKDGGYAPWDKPMCKRSGKIVVPTSVCNFHGSAQSYSIDSLGPLPTSYHTDCNIPGPTSFQIHTPSVTVPPAQCRTMYISVDRPLAMNSHNTIGCYEITFENNGNGTQFSRGASIWDTRNHCANETGQESGLVDLTPGVAQELVFQIQNTGGRPSLPYEFRVEPANMDEENQLIGLNGLEPGQAVSGQMRFFGNRAEVTVGVEALAYDPFRFFNIVLVANPGGEEVILDSVGVRPVPAPTVVGDRQERPGSTP